jgi:hypothetical protein
VNHERSSNIIPFARSSPQSDVLISRQDMDALPDDTPWHRFVEIGGVRVRFDFEKTSKGNGTLKFPGGGVRIYDSHNDGVIFQPFALDTRLVDLDHDRCLDLDVSGVVVRFDDKGDRGIDRRPVRAVFRFVPSVKGFTNVVSDPWIYTNTH